MASVPDKKPPALKKTFAVQVIQAILDTIQAQVIQTIDWGVEKDKNNKFNDKKHVTEDRDGRTCLMISQSEFAKRISVKKDNLFKKPGGAVYKVIELGLVHSESLFGPNGGRSNSTLWRPNKKRIELFTTAGLQLYALGRAEWDQWERAHNIADVFSYVATYGKHRGRRVSPFPTTNTDIVSPTYTSMTPYALSGDDRKILAENLKTLFDGQKSVPPNPGKKGKNSTPMGVKTPPFKEKERGKNSTLKGGKIPPLDDQSNLQTHGETQRLEQKEFRYNKREDKSGDFPDATRLTNHTHDNFDDSSFGDDSNTDNQDQNECQNIFIEAVTKAVEGLFGDNTAGDYKKSIRTIAQNLYSEYEDNFSGEGSPFSNEKDFLRAWGKLVRKYKDKIKRPIHLDPDEKYTVWREFIKNWFVKEEQEDSDEDQ